MKKLSFWYLGLASCATVYGTSVGGTTPCPTGPTPLSTYIADYSRGGCAAGIVTYTNFQLVSASANGVATPTANDIDLAWRGLGFVISYANTVPSGASNYSNFTIQYDFDPAPVLGSAELSLDVTGDVAVTEQICPGGTFTSGYCTIQGTDPSPVVLLVYNNPGNYNDSEPLGVSDGEINLQFSLAGDQGAAGFEAVQENFAAVTSTPEPATSGFVLLGGLFVMGAVKKSICRCQQQ